ASADASPAGAVPEAERGAPEGGRVMHVAALSARTVGLILSGAPAAHERLRSDFEPPLRARVEALGSALGPIEFVTLEDEAGEAELTGALWRQLAAKVG